MELTDLKGIGPKKKELLRKLDIYNVSDLYNYYPRSFEDRTRQVDIRKAKANVAYYFQWKIISRSYQNRARSMVITYIYASDIKTNTRIKIIWFNDRFSYQKLKEGEVYKFYTKVTYQNGNYEAINPLFTKLDDPRIGNLVAIYPLTAGINHRQLSTFIKEALKEYDPTEEILEENKRKEFSLSSKFDNLNEIHFPKTKEGLLKAKSEIKIIDFLKELIYIDYINEKYRKKQDIILNYNLDKILEKLDFTLTSSQQRALEEILADSQGDYLMNRLLIGDVGSGKTIIAIIAMVVFGLNSYQAAMMVPTEVLASQQFEKNKDFIESFGLKVGLLTGSIKDKESIKEKLKNGDIDLIIGTHAIIEDDVVFKDLRLVINDEQHRFGVVQRQALGQKGNFVNYLSMTATPIPRTLSLRIAKILDLSIINQLPAGRKPIETKVISQDMEKILFADIKYNLDTGRQVYVVSNNIDADDDNSVENLYKRYKKNFKAYKIAKLHGNMKASDKENTLRAFAQGEIDILISTTVIEVGIDVGNANTMIIYNANNFGLSSLHQLRGRVGRGSYKSFCYLVSKNIEKSSKLKILENNEDGFDIAKKDFELRGGGKILSSIQHGRNLSQVEFLSMDKKDIDRSFQIFDKLKEEEFQGVNFSYIEKFFEEDKRIILN